MQIEHYTAEQPLNPLKGELWQHAENGKLYEFNGKEWIRIRAIPMYRAMENHRRLSIFLLLVCLVQAIVLSYILILNN